MKAFWVPRSNLCLLFCLVFVSLSSFSSALPNDRQARVSLKFLLGEENLGPWRNGISEISAEAPGPSSDPSSTTIVLAAERTDRPDILRKFHHYHGGWNITDLHYWSSVGFTGAAGFLLAAVWFLSFGVVLVVHYCSRWHISNIKCKGSRHAQRVCLILLIIFTCAAATGCILLSVGQDEFHGEAMHTLKYVVNQSDYTVQTLKNVTEYLLLAKTINVAKVFLPSNVLEEIDKLDLDLNSAADTLKDKTTENAGKIVRVFNAVRSALITVAAVMLFLAILGFVLTILGHKHAVHIFILSGWLLVAITFILCGVFIILNNAISDTCLAMDEWVANPRASTALSSILSCVDQSTTNKTLIQSKQVINGIVNVVNTFVYTYANPNPSQNEFNYYNQSGPPMPPLCYPFDSQLQSRTCASQEVSVENASMVWKNYVCEVSPAGQCTTVGRVTPDAYRQLIAAVNESYALEHYAPFLLSLQDCKFVQETFEEFTSHYCPCLGHYLTIVNAGLGLISVGVLLCLVLWILYADRPRREEEFVKKDNNSSSSSRKTGSANKGNDGVVKSSTNVV